MYSTVPTRPTRLGRNTMSKVVDSPGRTTCITTPHRSFKETVVFTFDWKKEGWKSGVSPDTDVSCSVCDGLGLLIVIALICGIPTEL